MMLNRVSLNTIGLNRIGLNRIGKPSRGSSDRPYIDPEVLASLKAVCICYGKSNDDPDRAVVKNLVDPDNPFIISNAAFKLNSGFGKYSADFESFDWTVNISQKQHNKATISLNGRLCNHTAIEVDEMKVNIIGNVTELIYWYIANPDDTTRSEIRLTSGINTLPKSYAKDDGQTYNIGFAYISGDSEITIEQIPSFEGAFVTDGIDDLITSTKTVQEMLGGSTEFTAVSMIHLISPGQDVDGAAYTNYIRTSDNYWTSNRVSNTDKTGIYGYSFKQGTPTVIDNILGDKNDYTAEKADDVSEMFRAKFSIEGFEHVTNGAVHVSSVAWYWTIIANKVLTTDQINQVIAYFNLDRTLKPDILCDVKKQGITNDNHAEFGDKLIDYSGNGRDIQLNNIAWDGDSGIGKYNYPNWKVNVTRGNKYGRIVYYDSINGTYSADFKGVTELYKSYGLSVEIRVNRANTVDFHSIKEDGIYTVATPDDTTSIDIRFGGENVYNASCDITITQIPSHAGALCLDGVNDFGKVTGMPIYKDYTAIVCREFISDKTAPILSKAKEPNNGAFVMEIIAKPNLGNTALYSFGKDTPNIDIIQSKSISYQTKYIYNSKDIVPGNGVDSDTMWIGKLRDNHAWFANAAIYSLMSFPYSMNKYLIERQLKKHKLGTLYPNMVEFRPIVKSNSEYQVVDCYIDTLPAIVGNYYPINSKLRIAVTTKGEADEVTSLTINGTSLGTPSVNGNRFTFKGTLPDKSPQKINITIDEYIRYEDIVQPYPVFFEFTDENGNLISWGGKAKVGSTITRIGSIDDTESNLLNGLYSISGLSLNGKAVTSSTSIVEKQMVFKTTATYLLDNNEPNCILSPRLLRIPNSSYKILGYIPDISGHGNHGVIHNSAYAEGSGVNEDGSYQFDGVDDFVTIPTVTGGGKQVLMKVNNNTINSMLYDQRSSGASPNSLNSDFAIYNTNTVDNNLIAYQSRLVGKTYIDGILNTNITCEDLLGVLHNITITCDIVVPNNGVVPNIGKGGVLKDLYSKVALYDFMLFDEISTDDKIKELNEYVGIEAKVELPPYYWDAYGKTNLDEDKDTIQQRGVAEGDYDITNYNHAYDKMSGYGGYNLSRFDKSWSSSSNTSIKVVQRNPYDITLKKLGGNSDWEFNNTELKVISNPVSVKFKSNKNIRVTCDYHYYPVGGNSEGAPLGITSKDLIANKDAIITISPISQENIDKYNIDVNRGYYLIYFQLSSTLAVNEEVTIEMLPLYPNALLYDGVTDYSENNNIPALTDYTYIFKRELLNNTTDSCSLYKGDTDVVNGQGFVADYISQSGDIRQYSFGGYVNVPSLNTDKIIYGTKTSANGIPVSIGSGIDTVGMALAKWKNVYRKMVFYKLILYPKTIQLLQINFLKNMMERDEIIDLTNPIFIQE